MTPLKADTRANGTPDQVYSTGEGCGALIVDKFNKQPTGSGDNEASGQCRAAVGETEDIT